MDVHRGGVKFRVHHLAGHGALPNHLVELELVGRQKRLHAFGRAVHGRGADGFVRFLCVFGFGFVHARAVRQEIRADFFVDVMADFGERVFGQGNAVGTHVGNQADGALSHVDAFKKLLRGAHGAVGGKAQFAHGVLLHGGRGIGCGGFARGFLFRHFGHAGFLALQCDQNRGLGGFVWQRELLQFVALPLREFGGKLGAAFVAVQMHGPIFLRFKGADFVFAFANQPQRRALYAPGTQTAPDFLPQQRGQIKADQIIQRTARLLRVHQMNVQAARRFQSSLHPFGRDFMEHHALYFLFHILHAALGFQNFGNVPRNRFAFPIRVGGQVNVFRFFGGFHDFVHMLHGFGGNFVFHGEVVVRIDRAVFLDEVAHMAERGKHFEIAAQIFFDGFDFVGGFDNK